MAPRCPETLSTALCSDLRHVAVGLEISDPESFRFWVGEPLLCICVEMIPEKRPGEFDYKKLGSLRTEADNASLGQTRVFGLP